MHVTPKSGKDEICGIEQVEQGSELKVRVTAAPDGGKANKAVCKVVADALGVPKTSVTLASGATSRHKRLAIEASQAQVDAFLATFN